MEILISKIKKYKLLEELKSKFSKYKINKLEEGTLIPLHEIAKHINLDIIGYTFEDCLIDYSSKLKDQKEKLIVWKIWKKGYSIYSFQIKYNISNSFQKFLREGINYNSEVKGQNHIINLLETDLDFTNIKIVFYNSHIELFGEEKRLLKIRDEYNLSYDVIWEKEEKSYHLAFAGLLSEYIRKDQG
jgi:hypothetical protein